ncbi:hypothetical protein B5E77_11040 [Lachnoclostridium sp. An131]|uniref:DUF6128 domain-containing protein n=1 Tax=Lachnoclostridium sp. An131 TaxID=1965555 RepID=UPI000B3A53CA|nr:DUF6128 domain-containing protein [Lachnoclostridium sp. An131]OUQ25609.1 hypothetical protein B5E77_11040 [Lachnoclostridium sp. An131]
MSDYKRFVSYIYGYDQGEKGENTGFVKVNARGGECKIWVHVKGFYAHRQRPYRVYVFTQRKERLEGQYLGELESRNGALEWNGVTETDSLMGAFSLDESRGIYIEGENRVFAAEWDDYPVDVGRFRPLERSARLARVEENSEKNIGTHTGRRGDRDAGAPGKKEDGREAFERPETSRKNVPEIISEVSAERQTIQTDRQAFQTERQIVQETQQTIQAAQMAAVRPSLEEQGSQRGQPERASGMPEDPRRRQWEYLISHFPAVRYQDASGSVLLGIRLGNRELSRIPRDKWGLGNNSFLLHGFYQHHHLLLLRRQTESQVDYYIGVPGIYNEKEQMLASMFGFEEFKVMKGPDGQGENFGYWCRLLK